MKLDRPTILHRKDERGVIVESRAFGPDDEVPEDFGAATYSKIHPVTAQRAEVAESKLTPWESPIAKGTWIDQETEAVEEAAEEIEVDEDEVDEDDELDEGYPRQAREQSEDGDLTGAEEDVDESLESDEGESDDETENEVDQGTPVQAREQAGEEITESEEESMDTSGDVEVPPQGGAGSGRDVWAQYAAAKGVSVPEGATRDEIIDACKKAGVPVD
jgi:hypothetical protein